ncbi:hypothetical protein RJ640_002434, partial [Escallonia rubra]
VYAEGAARPTGGAAAIAMLIGPDAPIAFESKFRASYMSHVYDFYKPDLASEYPLVQKSFARLMFDDVVRNASSDEVAKEKLGPYTSLSSDESYQNRDLEKLLRLLSDELMHPQAAQQVAKSLYDAKVQPTTLIPKQVGNMYTASLYAAFASLIHNKHSTLTGNRVIMFSYGSGSTATMFSFRMREGQHPFTLSNIAKVMNVEEKLELRQEFPPEQFIESLKLMEHRYGGKDYVTSKDTTLLAPGTYYLTEVDSKYRRFYARKATACENGTTVANGH